MLKYFGIPILAALYLGWQIPYAGLASSTWAYYLLAFMMTLSYLKFDLTIFKKFKTYYHELTLGLLSAQIAIPLMTWFLVQGCNLPPALGYGAYFASLSPIAMVAPMFTKIHDGEEDLSLLLMILSTLFYPLFVFINLILVNDNSLTISIKPLIIDSIFITFAPLAVSRLISIYLPWLREHLMRLTPQINILLISFFAFTYLGASKSQLNMEFMLNIDFLKILLILLFLDFGVYFIFYSTFSKIFNKAHAKSLSISLSMKNFALAGGVLLFYDPKASFASAVGFLVHAFFFNYLTYNIYKEKTS